MYNPVKTIKTNTVGAVNALGLAKRVNAKILIASTSEVYGDPEVSFHNVEISWFFCHSDFIREINVGESRSSKTAVLAIWGRGSEND